MIPKGGNIQNGYAKRTFKGAREKRQHAVAGVGDALGKDTEGGHARVGVGRYRRGGAVLARSGQSALRVVRAVQNCVGRAWA